MIFTAGTPEGHSVKIYNEKGESEPGLYALDTERALAWRYRRHPTRLTKYYNENGDIIGQGPALCVVEGEIAKDEVDATGWSYTVDDGDRVNIGANQGLTPNLEAK